MSSLHNALQGDRVLLMDGAMGTELQKQDPNCKQGFDSWNLTNPNAVRAVHRAYAVAGADLLLANTFQANSNAQTGGSVQPARLLAEGIRLARSEASASQWVLACIGPFADASASTLVPLFAAGSDADGLLLETWSEPPPLPDQAFARPLLLSVTFWRRPQGNILTIHGETPQSLAAQSKRLPIAALGVNCGRDMDLDAILEVLRRYRQETDLPLFARPNAGTPTPSEHGWVYALTPPQLADRLQEFLELGVRMIGGCCGTTPAHIAAMRPVIDRWNANASSQKP